MNRRQKLGLVMIMFVITACIIHPPVDSGYNFALFLLSFIVSGAMFVI